VFLRVIQLLLLCSICRISAQHYLMIQINAYIFIGTCPLWWSWTHGARIWSCYKSSCKKCWHTFEPQVCLLDLVPDLTTRSFSWYLTELFIFKKWIDTSYFMFKWLNWLNKHLLVLGSSLIDLPSIISNNVPQLISTLFTTNSSCCN